MSSPHRCDLETQVRKESFPERGKRVGPDIFDQEVEAKRSSVERPTALPTHIASSFASNNKPRKRPNYLEHGERCRIIRRVDRGESQASLAREFGVTRAAICQLYKKREAILARGEPERGSDAPSPVSEAQVTPARHLDRPCPAIFNGGETQRDLLPGQRGKGKARLALSTIEAQSSTLKLLVSTLKSSRCSSAAFERAAARLTFILIEEAFAHYDEQAREDIKAGVRTANASDFGFCGIMLGGESSCFLPALLQIDTKAQSGQIHVKANREDRTSWQLAYLDVPDSITRQRILLFSTSGNGGAECKAIEALRSIGVQEYSITLVMVVCSMAGYDEISTRYPNIMIILATIDDEWELEEGLHLPTSVSRSIKN